MAFGAEPEEHRYRLRLARYKGMAEAVADYVRDPRNNREEPFDLLDVGVGKGRSLRFLEAEGLADSLTFTGLDKSEERLGKMYRPGRWNLVYRDVADGLPHPRNSFDICLCQQVLEHLRDPLPVVRELGRVLRPGGLGVIDVPVFPVGIAHLRRLAFNRFQNRLALDTSHPQTFTAASFLRLINKVPALEPKGCRGFRIVSGGPLRWLEHFYGWYRLNRAIGRLVAPLCTEIQVLVRGKNGDVEGGGR